MDRVQIEEFQKELDIRFTYHAPFGDQAERYAEIRRQALHLAGVLATFCPQSRELSVALTKLDEVVFWANASIARREENLDG